MKEINLSMSKAEVLKQIREHSKDLKEKLEIAHNITKELRHAIVVLDIAASEIKEKDQKISDLEQQISNLKQQLEEKEEETNETP